MMWSIRPTLRRSCAGASDGSLFMNGPRAPQGIDFALGEIPISQGLRRMLPRRRRRTAQFRWGPAETRRRCGIHDTLELDVSSSRPVVGMLYAFVHVEHRREAHV